MQKPINTSTDIGLKEVEDLINTSKDFLPNHPTENNTIEYFLKARSKELGVELAADY